VPPRKALVIGQKLVCLPEALNDTWRYLEKDLTLVTVPKAGHWVHVGPVQALGAADSRRSAW
jgi:hypothetical protein